MALANIALPLTNSFIGEFLMFNSLFRHSIILAAVAGVSIILAAVYTLWMVQKIFYGEVRDEAAITLKVPAATQAMLVLLVLLVLVSGIYPHPMIEMANDTVTKLLAQLK